MAENKVQKMDEVLRQLRGAIHGRKISEEQTGSPMGEATYINQGGTSLLLLGNIINEGDIKEILKLLDLFPGDAVGQKAPVKLTAKEKNCYTINVGGFLTTNAVFEYLKGLEGDLAKKHTTPPSEVPLEMWWTWVGDAICVSQTKDPNIGQDGCVAMCPAITPCK